MHICQQLIPQFITNVANKNFVYEMNKQKNNKHDYWCFSIGFYDKYLNICKYQPIPILSHWHKPNKKIIIVKYFLYRWRTKYDKKMGEEQKCFKITRLKTIQRKCYKCNFDSI